MEMEESFNVRVNKIFGSLSSSPSSSSSKSQSLSSLWCLTDDEIEKQEWNRDKDSPKLEPEHRAKQFRTNEEFGEKKPMDFRTELERDLDGLDDDVEEAGASWTSSKDAKPDDYNDEEWEIKSSIGLDCSLDYEEEEDEYDKLAVGNKGVDYLYMDDINDYETEADSYHRGLPTSFKDVIRDPRANHIAAKIRLKEDAEAAKRRLEEDVEAAKKINSLRVSENDAPANMNAQIYTSEDRNLKSILKRKDAESDSKSHKRVRFDSECKYDGREGSEGSKDAAMGTCCSAEDAKVSNQLSVLPQDFPSEIPDYMRNPSKYTRYTFDSSSDIDEESNRQAYMDFLKLFNKSDTTESKPDDSSDEPKPVTFIPRRKSGDATMVESSVRSKQNLVDYGKEPMQKRGLPIGIAAEDTEGDGVCMMEEDEPQTAANKKSSSQRLGRQYRMKQYLELD